MKTLFLLQNSWRATSVTLLTLFSIASLPVGAQTPTQTTDPNIQILETPTTQPTLTPDPLPLRGVPTAQPAPTPQPLLPRTADLFSNTYFLGPDDQLDINVPGFDEFTGQVVVLPDGTITLPLVGAVQAAGKTPEEFTRHLRERLSEYLINPVVSARLITLRPVVINVTGEVQRPGPVQLRSINIASNPAANFRTGTDRVPSVAAALVVAGGITRNADIRELVLSRPLPNGEFAATTLNLWDAVATDVPAQPLPLLQDGDTLFVPRLTADADIDRRLLARSTLAPENVRVRVVGEVIRPGEVLVPPDSSLSSAIAAAGGPTRDARLGKVKVVRLNELGQVERETINAKDLVDDYQIQGGDVVFVPTETLADALEFVGDILDPVSTFFGILRDVNRLSDDD